MEFVLCCYVLVTSEIMHRYITQNHSPLGVMAIRQTNMKMASSLS